MQEVDLELARAEFGAGSKRVQSYICRCLQQRTHHACRVTHVAGRVDHGGLCEVRLQATIHITS